ncbi:DNA-binding protein REB1 [Erysiphe neolycopersici]|uniref:DNA-binding protein REB1 n=1 Tax=Erysiphe neolycopersici TaxID=212602 RepID=A0A420I4F5_9PEZI|nr:DNA-binding protein REB1 [Erysiphe neolycopersici]
MLKTSNSKATRAASGRIKFLTDHDTERIIEAVNLFRSQNNLEQFEINEIVQKDAKKNKDAQSLWKFIRERLPTLPKQNVINACRRKFHNFEARGSWTASQDEELVAVYEQYPGKWKTIGEIINRFPEDCRDRWRNYLVCGSQKKTITWGFEEEERLRCIVGEYLDNYRRNHDTTNVDELEIIDWPTISKMMGYTRSRLQCSTKWKVIRDRYDTDDEDMKTSESLPATPWRLRKAERVVSHMSPQEKLLFLLGMRESCAKQLIKVPWVEIKRKNIGITCNKLELRLAFSRLREKVPNNDKMNLQDIVQYLIDVYEKALPNEPENFILSSPKVLKRKNTSSSSTDRPNKKAKVLKLK